MAFPWLIWSLPFAAALAPPGHISSPARPSDRAPGCCPGTPQSHEGSAWPGRSSFPPGNVAGRAGAAPHPGLSTKMGLPNPRQRCPAAERYGKSPSVLKKAPLQHLKSSFLANKMFTFKIIIIKKRIPALGHSVKWLQAHSSVCPLPSPSPNPATSPALYSRRVTDSPRSMLISVLNKHIGPGLRGKSEVSASGWQAEGTNFTRQALLCFLFCQRCAKGAG